MPMLSRKRKVVSYSEDDDEGCSEVEHGQTDNELDGETEHEDEREDDEQPADDMITEEDDPNGMAGADTNRDEDEQAPNDGENANDQPGDRDRRNDDLHTPHEEEDNIDVTPRLPSKRMIKRRRLHSEVCPKNPSRKLFGPPKKKKDNKRTSRAPRHIKEQSLKKKEGFQNREVAEQGVWIQCEDSQCKKWRFIESETDPANLTSEWTCNMHPDEKFNSCDKPEEDYSNLEFIHAGFTEGSVVWAKMKSYPWWPAMIETDPDTQDYMMHDGIDSDVTHYHCVFLDKNVSRSWVQSSSVEKFEASGKPPGTCFKKRKDYSKQIVHARERALDALKLSIKERIQTYGFSKTFKGTWAPAASDDDESIQGMNEDDVDEEVADILGSLLSTEDMAELRSQTEDMMPDAMEAVKKMDKQQKPKGARKRKPSKAKSKVPKENAPRDKRKKHKKHKSRCDKTGDKKKQRKHKRHQEKERRKEELLKKMTAEKDESATGGNIDSDIDDKGTGNSIGENEEAPTSKKSDGNRRHLDNSCETTPEEKKTRVSSEELGTPDGNPGSQSDSPDSPEGKGDELTDQEDIDQALSQDRPPSQKEIEDEIDSGKGDQVRDKNSDAGNKTVDDVEDVGKDEIPKKEEKNDVKAGKAKDDAEGESGGKDGEDKLEKGEAGLSKAEKKEKQKEREEKKKLIQDEKERKAKEKEEERLLKEQQLKEKEEKKKTRELKKQQKELELKEKEAKKGEKELQKLEKKGATEKKKKERKEKKTKKTAIGGKREKGPGKGSSKAASAEGETANGDRPPAKKPKFAAPKGKPKAFVAPTQVAENKEGSSDKTVKPEECDGVIQKDEEVGDSGEVESEKSSANSGAKTDVNTAPAEGKIVPNIRVAKPKKKKFCVKKKEVSASAKDPEGVAKKDNVKEASPEGKDKNIDNGGGGDKATEKSTDEECSDPPEKKVRREPVAVLDAEDREMTAFVCHPRKDKLTNEDKGNGKKNDVVGDCQPTEVNKLDNDPIDDNDDDSFDLDWSEAPVKATSPVRKVTSNTDVGGDDTKLPKVDHQDEDPMGDDGDNSLDLDWSEAPVKATSPAKKITSAVDEDSDPFETVEE